MTTEIAGVSQWARNWMRNHRSLLRTVGMLATSQVLGTALGLLGSLVQARYVTPQELGFVRKYSMVSTYGAFLSLGLFTILQREYPVLIGGGELDRARTIDATIHAWTSLASIVVGVGLTVVAGIKAYQGYVHEAMAWLVQVVAVCSILYGGYLTSIARCTEQFRLLARSQFASHLASVVVVPVLVFSPFWGLILRSVVGPIVSLAYLYRVSPSLRERQLRWGLLLNLVQRGAKLYVGNYLRYSFWLAAEIWLTNRLAGDTGVGLFLFGRMITVATSQISTAINQVYIPRLAQQFGRSYSVRSCLALSYKPTLLSILIAVVIIVTVWLLGPPTIRYALPNYVEAIPTIKILMLQMIIVSLSLPLYLVTIVESHLTQIGASVLGLMTMFVVATMLQRAIPELQAIALGTVCGQSVYVLVGLAYVLARATGEPDRV